MLVIVASHNMYYGPNYSETEMRIADVFVSFLLPSM